jgi:hypothetical protein
MAAAFHRVLSLVKKVNSSENVKRLGHALGEDFGKVCQPLLVPRQAGPADKWKPCGMSATVALRCFAGICAERLTAWEHFDGGLGLECPNCMQLQWSKEEMPPSLLQLFTSEDHGVTRLTLRYYILGMSTPTLDYYYCGSGPGLTSQVQTALLNVTQSTLVEAPVISARRLAPDFDTAPRDTWCLCLHRSRRSTVSYLQKPNSPFIEKNILDLISVDERRPRKSFQMFWAQEYPSTPDCVRPNARVSFCSRDVLFAPLQTEQQESKDHRILSKSPAHPRTSAEAPGSQGREPSARKRTHQQI